MYYLAGERKYRPRTVLGAFYPIKGLVKHLLDVGGLKSNPFDSLRLPQKDTAQRALVSQEEVLALLDACERQRNPRQVALARVCIAILIYAGLRRSEMLDLTTDDVDLKENEIRIRKGKGEKERYVWICEPCSQAIREWLAVREQDAATDYLLLVDKRRRLYHDGLKTLFDEIKAVAGMSHRADVTPHCLRHFYASNLLQNGAPLNAISRALRHSALSTTADYLRVQDAAVKRIAALSTLSPTTQGTVSASPGSAEDAKTHLPVTNERHRVRLIRRER